MTLNVVFYWAFILFHFWPLLIHQKKKGEKYMQIDMVLVCVNII